MFFREISFPKNKKKCFSFFVIFSVKSMFRMAPTNCELVAKFYELNHNKGKLYTFKAFKSSRYSKSQLYKTDCECGSECENAGTDQFCYGKWS